MIESLMLINSKRKIYLSSGPGPSELIGGDEDAGFFGEVPADEFITGDQLASALMLNEGVSQNSTTPWLKFFIDDKILFIPKKTLRHSISWDHINAVNAVYGDRSLDLLGYRFKIRLLQGINPGESATTANGSDLPITHQSEWNRLMYPICEDIVSYPKTSQIGPNWVSYTQAELNITSGDGRYTWCQETPSNSPSSRAFRGHYAVSYLLWNGSSTTSASLGWRPVLELVTT